MCTVIERIRRMKAVYEEAANLQTKGHKFVLATVVNTKGSTPQKPGATLLVREDGSTVGTLGGGCVEGDIWFAAKEALRRNTGPIYKDYYLNEEIAAKDGLVCGGSMFFYIEPVTYKVGPLDLAKLIDAAYQGGAPLAVATLVKSTRFEIGHHLVIHADGSTRGTMGESALDNKAISLAPGVIPMGKTHRFYNRLGDEVFIQGFTSPATLILLGGGHVNLQVAKIASIAGYRVMVADDRPDFANNERFPMAESVAVAPYDRPFENFPINANTAIVIGTRGHNFDDMALEAAVKSDAGYIGLLGSKRKTILIYKALIKRGIPLEKLELVHSPIGLDLGGRNPEEIAVSIVAELQAFRYGRQGGYMKLAQTHMDRLAQQVVQRASQ